MGEKRSWGEQEQGRGKEEKERVLELLLSQERVISLLYNKTFPPRSSLTSSTPAEADGATGSELADDWLDDPSWE